MRKQSNKLFSFLNGIKWRDLRLIMRVVKLVKRLAKFINKGKTMFELGFFLFLGLYIINSIYLYKTLNSTKQSQEDFMNKQANY